MANREPTFEDILAFMDDGERADWSSGKGTDEERSQFRANLEQLWRSIPDPPEDELKPPYMHVNDWAAHQNGSKDVLPFYFRKWKRERKAQARAEHVTRSEAPPEPEMLSNPPKSSEMDVPKPDRWLPVESKEPPESLPAPKLETLADEPTQAETGIKQWYGQEKSAGTPDRDQEYDRHYQALTESSMARPKSYTQPKHVNREDLAKLPRGEVASKPTNDSDKPHWFETVAGDARLWGVIALIALAIAFSRRSANSDIAVWLLLALAAILGVLVVNTHRSVRSSRYRALFTIVAILIGIPIVLVGGRWLTEASKEQAPKIEVKVEKANRSHVHVSEFRFTQPPPRRVNIVIGLTNNGILDANTQVYYLVDFKKVPVSDLEMSRLEDDLYGRLVSYMRTASAVTNTIPAAGERLSEAMPADLTEGQWRDWSTGKYAVYYIGEIKYQDTTGDRASRFCISARSNGDVLSCRHYNEEP